MASTLLLFDIDGTLVQTRAGRRAFNSALARVFGLTDAAAGVAMAGRTDPAIFHEICDRHGLDPRTYGAWKLEFLADLATELQADSGVVLPGVQDLLTACHRDPRYVLALGTGNVEEGARMKLAPHDLNRFFAVGGFGTDGVTRADVIASGIARAEALHGAPFASVIVIGDTPADIDCGKANRCRTLAVATGPFSVTDLQGCQPDAVIGSFADTDRILDLIERMA